MHDLYIAEINRHGASYAADSTSSSTFKQQAQEDATYCENSELKSR